MQIRSIYQALIITVLLFSLHVIPAGADSGNNYNKNFKSKFKEKIAERILESEYAQKSCKEKNKSFNWKKARKNKRGKMGGPDADLNDVSYAPHWRQSYDVFFPSPKKEEKAPVIVMVHGGGWCIGDKKLGAAMQNKVERWATQGFILVSVNYRMLPDDTSVTHQAEDVAKAIAHIQENAHNWGGDAERIIVMGHSAGAHLVSLVGASVERREKFGVKPWLLTVSLDSGTINTPDTMQKNSLILFSEAFGSDPAYWRETSPFHQMNINSLPWLGICAAGRAESCPQAEEYAKKSNKLGVTAKVLPFNLGHSAINKELGQKGIYTEKVEFFMAKSDPVIAKMLGR